jgi:poly(hydroxyalkanoate) depolymerase family esterase
MILKKSFLTTYFFVCCILFTAVQTQAQIEDFQLGSTTRQMLVYAPSGLQPNSPLLLSLHGMNQDIAYQQNQTKWELVAKEYGFVVVYPGGINNSWDIMGTSDIDFILAIIDEMYERYAIDRNRVYLSGFSMGGMMTYHAANYIADKIAAFAPVSGYLMGGPNTNSSRPIPIIHTHGTSDDVVSFSGVQPCLDAWIARNNCPTTAVVTNPYPADKPNSNGTKYYWGPGTDSVEVVLLSLKNKGHWHSNEPNGVHTSQEIWNFCKKFTLAYGIPGLKQAVVNDSNPKQILLNFSLPISLADNYDGFTVKIDSQEVVIENVVLADSMHLAINLSDSITKNNQISVSYSGGNVVSTYEKNLAGFEDAVVDNLLFGAPPRIVEMWLTENGDTLIAKFNKNMLLPADVSTLGLQAEYTDIFDIPLSQSSFYENDSTILCFELGEQVFADYQLLLSYGGENMASADSGLVKNFTNLPVNNTAKGLPVQLVSATLEDNAFTIALEFTKPMRMNDEQIDQMAILVNNESVVVKEIFTANNTIRIVLKNNVYYGDTIKVSYTPGDITATDKGELEAFSNIVAQNNLAAPTWVSVPGKIEAENYTLQFGTDTEVTGDAGGGLNVGWTDTGDWLVYAIENTSDSTNLEILFRFAAQSSGARFDYYIDDERMGFFNVPSTGAWQNWNSSSKTITIPAGKHYLKFVTVNGGFNLNYFEIKEATTGIDVISEAKVVFYPNPITNELCIDVKGFKHNEVEIYNLEGALVKALDTNGEEFMRIPVSLPNGLYMVKIKNDTQFLRQKIQVNK